jgi:two-component system, chemotaxis family, sensor kinase CheA
MDQRDLTARLLVTFLQELEEQARDLNAGLLLLEQQPDNAEHIRSVFRAAHTVKGAARVAGVPLVEQVCHSLEAVFAGVRNGERRLEGRDYSLLFAVVDALVEAVPRLRAGESLDNTTLAALLPRIAAMTDEQPAPSADRAARHAPAPATPERGTADAGKRDATATSAEVGPHVAGGGGAGAGYDTASDEADAHVAGDGGVDTGHDPAPIDRRRETADAPRETGEELVRVRADRLDELLSAVGELIVATDRVVAGGNRQDEDAHRLDGATDAVADLVQRLRLRPFADVCEALPRAARDVAAAAGKEVDLELDGQQVEADRMVMDALREPLLHLVRNAVDHGIEPPDQRESMGKERKGHVRINAELTGGRLMITVADDGAGLDENAVRGALRSRGRHVPETRAELAEAVLAGGFTTRSEATAISGRGVGVDLVRSAIERIGGALDVEWRQNGGTTFTIECPPTPATIRALLVRIGAHTFAIPTSHVERLRRIDADELHHVEGRTVLRHGTAAVPVHSLAALLGPPLDTREIEGTATIVIVNAGVRRAALVVDTVIDETEIVVRPLEVDDGAVPHVTGATILPSGTVALVLGIGTLLAAAGRAGASIAPAFAAERDTARRRILVADDSITTRTLEQSVLEAAGFDVATAVNGEDAWQQLERDGADMIVADVEMPRMDGFELCRRVRASARFSSLPIALVTGLASDEDRARGLEAGADAYIIKSSFDQATLLDVVHQLIGDT